MGETMRTEEYAEATIVASSLNEKGVDFVYSGLMETENRAGKAFVAKGTKNGEYFGVMFNSTKLATLFIKNHNVLSGKMINLSKRGTGVNSNFDVKILS